MSGTRAKTVVVAAPLADRAARRVQWVGESAPGGPPPADRESPNIRLSSRPIGPRPPTGLENTSNDARSSSPPSSSSGRASVAGREGTCQPAEAAPGSWKVERICRARIVPNTSGGCGTGSGPVAISREAAGESVRAAICGTISGRTVRGRIASWRTSARCASTARYRIATRGRRSIPSKDASRLPAAKSEACTVTERSRSTGAASGSTKIDDPSVHASDPDSDGNTSTVRPARADATSRYRCSSSAGELDALRRPSRISRPNAIAGTFSPFSAGPNNWSRVGAGHDSRQSGPGGPQGRLQGDRDRTVGPARAASSPPAHRTRSVAPCLRPNIRSTLAA